MKWPVDSAPMSPSELPFFNLHYLYGCRPPGDPTIVWGTEVDAERLQSYVLRRNELSDTVVSVVHVLLKAVGKCLVEYPELNYRAIRRRLHRFKENHIRLVCYNRQMRDVDLVLLKDADQLTVPQIARQVWKNQRRIARGDSPEAQDRLRVKRLPRMLLAPALKGYLWLDRNVRLPNLRINRKTKGAVIVNYLGFPGAPSMRSYVPSRYPDESSHLSITMGRIEPRAVVRDDEIVARAMAPLIIRADHRIADAHLLAQFMRSLIDYLEDPARLLDEQAPDSGQDHPIVRARAA